MDEEQVVLITYTNYFNGTNLEQYVTVLQKVRKRYNNFMFVLYTRMGVYAIAYYVYSKYSSLWIKHLILG